MSERELASARSFWKRKNLRDGRRSRYVEVEEVSLDSLRADAVENGLVDEVVSVLATGKEADVYVGLWKKVPLALKVYRLHRTPHKKKSAIGYSVDRMARSRRTSSQCSKRPTAPEYQCRLRREELTICLRCDSLATKPTHAALGTWTLTNLNSTQSKHWGLSTDSLTLS